MHNYVLKNVTIEINKSHTVLNEPSVLKLVIAVLVFAQLMEL